MAMQPVSGRLGKPVHVTGIVCCPCCDRIAPRTAFGVLLSPRSGVWTRFCGAAAGAGGQGGAGNTNFDGGTGGKGGVGGAGGHGGAGVGASIGTAMSRSSADHWHSAS